MNILYLGNNVSYSICLYIVGKHLPSSKRWFTFRLDISVPAWEISVLKSTQIPEESENLEFVVGSKKKRQMAYFLHQDHRNQNFSQLAYLNYNKIYTTAVNKGMAFCSDNKFWKCRALQTYPQNPLDEIGFKVFFII